MPASDAASQPSVTPCHPSPCCLFMTPGPPSKGIMKENTQPNGLAQTPLSLLTPCPGRLGRTLSGSVETCLITLQANGQIVFQGKTGNTRCFWGRPVAVIEVEMTKGALDATLPERTLEETREKLDLPARGGRRSLLSSYSIRSSVKEANLRGNPWFYKSSNRNMQIWMTELCYLCNFVLFKPIWKVVIVCKIQLDRERPCTLLAG